MRTGTSRNDTPGTDSDALETRRSLLRRSTLGVMGIGLAGLLAACGDDDEDPAVTGDGGGQEDEGEDPGIEEETGIDDEADGDEEGDPEADESPEDDDSD